MSVKSTRTDEKVTFELELTNERYKDFEKAMKKWNFNDEESLFQFAISLLAFNEYEYFPLKFNGNAIKVLPARYLEKVNGVH